MTRVLRYPLVAKFKSFAITSCGELYDLGVEPSEIIH
jgi:hypothetical protein